MGITFDKTLSHIQFLATVFGRDRVRHVIVVLLLELDIPTNYDGFDYLVRGIMIYFKELSLMMVKGLYPAIAATYEKEVEAPQIESAIRSAIGVAWKRYDAAAWERYFPGMTEKPSNAEFISRIARFLELWEGCCKENEKKSTVRRLQHER